MMKLMVMRPFCFPVRIPKEVIITIHKIQKHIKNDRAEATYISTVVYILVVVVTLAVIMDVLAVVMTKQKLDAAGEMSNGFVMGIVGMNVLGLTVLIMTIFTRKSLVQYLFNLAWAGCSLYMAFGENFVLQKLAIDSAAKSVYPTLKILAIASIVLVLLRGYPWFYSRYIYKKPIDLEALNA